MICKDPNHQIGALIESISFLFLSFSFYLLLFLSHFLQSLIQIFFPLLFVVSSESLPLFRSASHFLSLFLCGFLLSHQILNRHSNHSSFGFDSLLFGRPLLCFQNGLFLVCTSPYLCMSEMECLLSSEH